MNWNKSIFVTQLRRSTHEKEAIRREAHKNLFRLWKQNKPLFDKLRADIEAEYHSYPQSKKR